MELTFRFAQEADTPLILRFIRDLAEYEHMADQVVADEATLKEQLFDRRGAEVLFALENGKEVGFALFFHNFSTFLGRAGLYLEDLYVLPEHRGKGYGKALIDFLIETYAGQYTVLQVGTGDSPSTIPFYEACGFRRHHLIKNFFTDHYDHPIYECGVQLVDMVYLQREL